MSPDTDPETSSGSPAPVPLVRYLVWFCLLASAAIIALLLIAGPGRQLGWWNYGTGMYLVRLSVMVGLGLLPLTIITLAIVAAQGNWGLKRTATCLLVLTVVLAVPLNQWWNIQSLPTINDVTTDPVNPPEFSTDATANNLPDTRNLRLQQDAYGDLGPLLLKIKPNRALNLVRFVAEGLNWQDVTIDDDKRRLTAVAETFWFGFKDDVVVRLTPKNGSTRVDVRSRSRVGRHDLGKNARRIRRFFVQVERRLDEPARRLKRPQLTPENQFDS